MNSKTIHHIILVAVMLALLSTVTYATATNVSIFYGWNGSTFVPLLTDASGKLQTDINITTSVGMNPKTNNTYDLGSLAKVWANIYTRSVRSGSTLSLFAGSTEAITILANGFVGIGTATPNSQLTINGNISFTNGPKIIDDNGKLKLQAGGSTNGTTSSIYFLDSGGVVRGRFETNYSSNLITNTFTDTSNTDFNTGVYNNTNTSGTGVGTNLTLNVKPFSATGGTITYSGGYTIHTFTANETFTPSGAGNVEYLLVAGGGGGGPSGGANSILGGGGGAGGMVEGASHSVTAQAYTVTVGTGGPSSASGSNSVFDGVTALGGGRGATYGGISGGSGGGTEGCGGATGGAATQGNSGDGIGYGYKGGDSLAAMPCATSGGGGAGGEGGYGGSNSGAGGAGRSNSISGSSVIYAAGGGGGASSWGAAAGAGGSSGVGGAGGYNGAQAGTAGTANRGAGGGGAANFADPASAGGAGSSGIVIIRYLTNLTSGYRNSGNFTSRVFDANQTVTWSSIFWDNVSSLNTSIMLKTRTSANNVTFTDWMNHTTSPSSITQNSSNRYLQYQVQMNTTNTSLTPYLLNVSVSYSYSTASSNNTYGTLYVGTTNTAAADLAEYYATGELLEAGDVVSVSNEKLTLNGKEITTRGVLRKSRSAYDKNILGTISTTPGLILGSYDSEGKSLLALAGRTPVKVSAENGPIDIGDYLTSSSRPGIAMKATRPGMVIGRALETSDGPGKIDVLIGVGEGNIVDKVNQQQQEIDLLTAEGNELLEKLLMLETKAKW